MSGDLLRAKLRKCNEAGKQSVLDKVVDLTTCSVCQDCMYVPMILNECGHTYCYGCISSWFNGCSGVFTCPICRLQVETAPGLNLSLQQMLNTIIELKKDGSNTGDDKFDQQWMKLLKAKIEAVKKYKKDAENNQLFNRVFYTSAVSVVDADDEGVIRCSNCHWELEDDDLDTCPHCSFRLRARHSNNTANRVASINVSNDNSNRGNTNNNDYNDSEYSEGEYDEIEREMHNSRNLSGNEENRESDSDDDIINMGSTNPQIRNLDNRFSDSDQDARNDSDEEIQHSERIGLDDEDEDEDERERDGEEQGDYSELVGFVVDDEDSIDHENVDDGLSSQDSDFYEYNERSPEKVAISDSDEDETEYANIRTNKRPRAVLEESDESDTSDQSDSSLAFGDNKNHSRNGPVSNWSSSDDD